MNQYIHIGAEVAAIATLSIKFSNRLKKLEERISALEEMNRQKQPKVEIFETQSSQKDPMEFLMGFFPIFANQNQSNVTIEEIQEEIPTQEISKDQLKSVFIKHLAFLADDEEENTNNKCL